MKSALRQETLYCIPVGNKNLNIIYNKSEEGLFTYFSSDERMAGYILNNPEESYVEALSNIEENVYVLNIASTQDFGAFNWKEGWSKQLLNKQLSIFMPIIQKFMVENLIHKE